MNSKARMLAEDNDLRMAWKPHLRQPCVKSAAPVRSASEVLAGASGWCAAELHALMQNLFAPDLSSRDNDHSCA
jgi:hypothetical protein